MVDNSIVRRVRSWQRKYLADAGFKLARFKAGTRARFFTRTGALGLALYSAGNPVYSREKQAVFHGTRKFFLDGVGGEQRFMLRRQLHMLEKGLCMSPRRETFATDYIDSTVDAFAALLNRSNDDGSSALSEIEIAWGFDVLDDYFVATAGSSHSRIVCARGRYKQISARGRGDVGESRPYAVGSVQSRVEIDDLVHLSRVRTSVRRYRAEPVEQSVLDQAVDVALESPTACNRVPWTVRIFRQAESARSVAKIAMGTAGYLENISGLAVFVGDLSAYAHERDRHLIYIDSSLAAMSFILALQSQNVSSCCVNWPDIPEREKRMAAALGLQAHERVVMLVLFGYADGDGLTPYSAKTDVARVRRFE